jgi:hypothetical protein
VLRPAEILNYRSLGDTPAYLGAGLAAGAVAALGIALGRTLWDLFAHDINAVPAPSVPVSAVVLIAVGALVLANVIAAVPGRLAARTPTALVLRSE